jgi:hypothetical protein
MRRIQSAAEAKRVLSTEHKLGEARRLSFRTFAPRWVDDTLFYRSGGYVAQTGRWLDAYVCPAIRDKQLDQVRPGDVLAIIKARADTAVTAERIRVIVQQIYNHAIDDEPGAAAARRHRAHAGRTPLPPEREGTGGDLALAGRAGRAHHDDRGDQAAVADDDPQERRAALEVARARPRCRAVGHPGRAHDSGRCAEIAAFQVGIGPCSRSEAG